MKFQIYFTKYIAAVILVVNNVLTCVGVEATVVCAG